MRFSLLSLSRRCAGSGMGLRSTWFGGRDWLLAGRVLALSLLTSSAVAPLDSQVTTVRYEVSYRTTAGVEGADFQEPGESARFTVSTMVRDTLGGQLISIRLDSILDSEMSVFQMDSNGVAPEVWSAITRGSGVTVIELQGARRQGLLSAEPLLHPLIGPLRVVLALIMPPLSGRAPGQQWVDTMPRGRSDEQAGIFDGFTEVSEKVPLVYHWNWADPETIEVSAMGSHDVVRKDAYLTELLRTTSSVRVVQSFKLDSTRGVSEVQAKMETTVGGSRRNLVSSVQFDIRRLSQ